MSNTKLNRRTFLLTLGAGGATGAAAILGTTAPQAPPAASAKRKTRGYHPSEHIRNYYRTAKV